MTLARLKWITILAPLVFLGVLELVRWRLAPDLLSSWPGYLLIGGVALLAVAGVLADDFHRDRAFATPPSLAES
jgi:hypothetical protein